MLYKVAKFCVWNLFCMCRGLLGPRCASCIVTVSAALGQRWTQRRSSVFWDDISLLPEWRFGIVGRGPVYSVSTSTQRISDDNRSSLASEFKLKSVPDLFIQKVNKKSWKKTSELFGCLCPPSSRVWAKPTQINCCMCNFIKIKTRFTACVDCLSPEHNSFSMRAHTHTHTAQQEHVSMELGAAPQNLTEALKRRRWKSNFTKSAVIFI